MRIFDHVDLRVHSLGECGPFYEALLPQLGFTERAAIEGWLQFEARGAGVTEFFGVTEDQQHRPNRTRIAFWAESKQKIDQLAPQLATIGARNIEGPEFIEPSYYAVYFDDPSGNPLEICFRTETMTTPSSPVHAPPPLPTSRRDEEHLRLLALFHYVVAALGAVLACFPFLHVGMGVMMLTNPEWMSGGANGKPPPAAVAYVFIAMGVLFVLIGWGAAACTFISGRMLVRRRRRMFSFVVAALLCMFFPFGTALGVFTIIVLSRESVQRLYEEA